MQESEGQSTQLLRAGGVRKFALLAALSAPWLALLSYLAYLSRFITDDAFISFRYARNLLEGNGLVWNPGERVEGYSNFLWTLELAAIWRLTGIPPEDAVWGLTAAYTAATLGAMAWWAWRLPGLRERGFAWWMALGLLCGSVTFAAWSLGGGLETRQFTFFVVAAVVALTAHRRSRRGLLIASSSLALASLTRPEGLLAAACCFAWWAAQEAARASRERRGEGGGWLLAAVRRADWRGALWLALPFALIVGAHFLWRYSYYGEWLPNTYYAKVVRPWWDVGLRYLAAAGLETGLYLLLPLAAWGAWARWREERDLAYGLPLLIIALHAAHIARVGGDAMGWRPMDFYWPLLALPAADGTARAGRGAARLWARRRAGSIGGGRAWGIALFAVALFCAGAVQGALLREFLKLDNTNVQHTELHWGNAAWVLAAPWMPPVVALSNELRSSIAHTKSGKSIHRYLREFRDQSLQVAWGQYEDMERGLIPDDATAVVKSAGAVSYYLPDLRFVDYYGLNDKVIARNPVTRPNSERLLFHDRFPPPGYLDDRGVNFEPHFAKTDAAGAIGAARYAMEVSPGVWMPFDAPSLEWVEERFDAFVTADSLYALIERNGTLLISSHFNVYDVDGAGFPFSGGRLLAYLKRPCAEEDAHARFLLHLTPADTGDLPKERRRYGFDNLNFALSERGVRRGETCVALRALPDYPIVSFHAGQFIEQVGTRLWGESFRFIEPEDAAEALGAGARPAASSHFDVYVAEASDSDISGGRRLLVYVKEPCAEEDARAKFFLHLIPADESDLPEYRRRYGFDNRDFAFAGWGSRTGERCVAFRHLPDYPVAAVRTGQFTDEVTVWSEEFRLAGGGS